MKEWNEKVIESKFPSKVCFELASKKVKEAIFNNMSLRVYEPNDVILQAGCMPDDLLFLISGKIQLLQEKAKVATKYPAAHPHVVTQVVGPTKKQILLEKTHGEVFLEKVINENE